MAETRKIDTGYGSYTLYQQPVKEVIRTPAQEKARQQSLRDAEYAKAVARRDAIWKNYWRLG